VTEISNTPADNQHYRTRVVRDGYWRERAEQAVADWHRQRAMDAEPKPLSLRERFSSFRLGRIEREVVR
jgi:hypothetical protein